MAVPQVGVTHDVVIYDGAGNLAPVGLVVRPYSYRVGSAPTFVPRMAVGDPRGTDYDAFTSHVQQDWRGRSQVEEGSPHDYARMAGAAPTRGVGRLRPLQPPATINITRNTASPGEYDMPAGGRVPVVQGVVTCSICNMMDRPSTRIFVGRKILLPQMTLGALYAVRVQNSLPSGRYAYDAVQFSGVAFVSTYTNTWSLIQAHVNDTVYTPVAATLAGALSVYDSKLWRGEPGGSRLAYYDVTYDTVGDSVGGFSWEMNRGWSDWVDTEPGTKIRALEPFVGRLFAGCDDGLYAYEAGRTYKAVDFGHLRSQYNFTVLKAAHGSLWFNIGHRLFRYTAGGMLEEMAFETLGQVPWAMVAGPGCIYIMTKRALSAGVGYAMNVFRMDLDTGAVQEVVPLDILQPSVGYTDRGAATLALARQIPSGVIGASDWYGTYLMIGPMLSTIYQDGGLAHFYNCGKLERIHGDQTILYDTDGAFQDARLNAIETVWIDFSYPALDKEWQRVRITGSLPTAGQRITVWYRTQRGAGWTLLGDLSVSAMSLGWGELSLPTGLSSKELQLRIGFYLTDATQSRPYIRSVEVDSILGSRAGRPARHRVQFNAVVVDELELIDRTVENSAAWVAASLYSLAGSRVTHTVGLPFPPPVGHTTKARVELGAIGAVVPILGYSGLSSGSPGADFSLTLTEV